MNTALSHFNTHPYQAEEAQTAYVLGFLEYALEKHHSYAGRKQALRQKFLDVGIGTGERPALFRDTHPDWDLYGLDGAPENLDRCKANRIPEKNLTLIDLEKEQFPFDFNTFDLVVSIDTLNYLQNACQVIEEMIKVAKPFTPIVLSLVTHSGVGTLLCPARTPVQNPDLHWYIPPAQDFKTIFNHTSAAIVEDFAFKKQHKNTALTTHLYCLEKSV